MYFNEQKYKDCIESLIATKAAIVFLDLIIFAGIGAGIAWPIMKNINGEYTVVIIGACIGAIVGILISLLSTWKVEMKIQEAYWKIDLINEVEKQSSIANKNTPVAKTVVAIENKSLPPAGTNVQTFENKQEN